MKVLKKFFYFLIFCLSFLLVFQVDAVRSMAVFKKYSDPLTAEDKTNISYIVNTLADNSVFQLMMQKRSLESAGEKIAEVHPLRFLAYIFTDKELSHQAKKIKNVPWKQFAIDMGKSLKDAEKQGLVTPEDLEAFSKETGIDISILSPYVKEHKWKEFVSAVRDAAQ